MEISKVQQFNLLNAKGKGISNSAKTKEGSF